MVLVRAVINAIDVFENLYQYNTKKEGEKIYLKHWEEAP